MCFSVEDLFVVGISLDIVGGALLGLGLLSSSTEIALRSSSYTGYSPPLAISQSKAKVDGVFGLFALLSGFLLQAVAYVLTLSGQISLDPSWSVASTAIAIAIVVGVAYLGLWRLVRMRLVKRELVRVARVNNLTRPMRVIERPYALPLIRFGEELGEPLERENEDQYLERVFGVTDFEPGGPHGHVVETPTNGE